ncbi:hypothetical protein [Agarivorans sp. Toyoura001]|uniref:hypothetical protein n=1 Tax=unclassified Agarivorans TaxID=2636026 RepID=UPI0010EB7650|nr:hypothetical protein [Agarivorans sp. Toyoura001]GDY25412.1 hypothetical protein AHAT_13020 [Agarivorans sp. Toyoura001]
MKKTLIVASAFTLLSACSSSAPEQNQGVMITESSTDVVDCNILGVFNVDPQSLESDNGKQELSQRVLDLKGNAVQLIPLSTAEPELVSAHVYQCPEAS